MNNPAETSTPAPLARGDKVTAPVDFHGSPVEAKGRVHHIGMETFFVQLSVGTERFNRYLKVADEGETWKRGWGE